MSIFWKKVFYLEKINLKFFASTTDGASPYRTCFKTIKLLDGDVGTVCNTEQKVITHKRMIFFSDTLHLIKKLRNSLFNSDLECGLKLLNELTSDPINITSYSVMMVNLRRKVLSETVDNQLNSFGPEETAGTGKLCIREENV